MSYHMTGHSLSTNKLLRNVLHLHPLHGRLQSPRSRPQVPPLHRSLYALRRILRPDRNLHHDLGWRIPGVPKGEMERPDFPIQLYDDGGIPRAFRGVEIIEADAVVEA